MGTNQKGEKISSKEIYVQTILVLGIFSVSFIYDDDWNFISPTGQKLKQKPTAKKDLKLNI